MNMRKATAALACGLAVGSVLFAFQRPFREFDGEHWIPPEVAHAAFEWFRR